MSQWQNYAGHKSIEYCKLDQFSSRKGNENWRLASRILPSQGLEITEIFLNFRCPFLREKSGGYFSFPAHSAWAKFDFYSSHGICIIIELATTFWIFTQAFYEYPKMEAHFKKVHKVKRMAYLPRNGFLVGIETEIASIPQWTLGPPEKKMVRPLKLGVAKKFFCIPATWLSSANPPFGNKMHKIWKTG